jgi:hypothetical protein
MHLHGKQNFITRSFKLKISPLPITHEDWEKYKKFNLTYQNCIYQIHYKGNVFAESLKPRTKTQSSAESSLNTNGIDVEKWSSYPSENKILLLHKGKTVMLCTEQLYTYI